MKATLTFPKRVQAEAFATAWGRYSKTGHTLGSGIENVSVTVYGLNDDKKEWIDKYVLNINQLTK